MHVDVVDYILYINGSIYIPGGTVHCLLIKQLHLFIWWKFSLTVTWLKMKLNGWKIFMGIIK